MFQGLLENLLKTLIGEYVEQIDGSNINMSVYSGIIDLKELNLKKDIFRKLNIPITLEIGRIKKLFITVPWNALSSKPVQFEIDGLMLLICPLKENEWLSFVEQHNQFDVLEQRLIHYCKSVFQDLIKNTKNESQNIEEQGYFMNLTTKIVDNIQISIKNLHIRYEDCQNFGKPFSMGLTLEQLDIDTTNEDWEAEFIDRTLAENKLKPLQKIINLKKFGFYCNPKDSMTRMISSEEINYDNKQEQIQKFESLFSQDDKDISQLYKNWYLSKPISSITKLKKLSEYQVRKIQNRQIEKIEPLNEISLEIDQIDLCLLKSQFELIFRAIDHLNDFQRFTDNFLNKKAILLQNFYLEKDNYEKVKKTFGECILKIIEKEIKILSYEGQNIPQKEMDQINQDSEIEKDKLQIFMSLVSYENKLKLQKWAKNEIMNNFERLRQISESRKKKLEEEQKQNSGMMGYIASSMSWLGAGAMQALYSQEQPLQIENQIEDDQKQQILLNEQAFKQNIDDQSNFNEDEFQDAIDYEQNEDEKNNDASVKNLKLKHMKSFVSNVNSDQSYLSFQDQQLVKSHSLKPNRLQNNIFNSLVDDHNLKLSQNDQSYYSEYKNPDDTNVPIFFGIFHIKKTKISVFNDTQAENLIEESHVKISDKADNQNDDYLYQQAMKIAQKNEIIMFSRNFIIKYNHYDSKDFNNLNQVRVSAQCKDIGVQLIQKQSQNNERKKNYEVIDIIYRMDNKYSSRFTLDNKELTNQDEQDLLNIELDFGNQNIKEQMISKLQSTDSFVDQEIKFRFRPITYIYRQEFMKFLTSFLRIKDGLINDEVKLRALEEYEKLRQSVSLQNVFENNQIQNCIKLKIELDSSNIVLPIKHQLQGKKQECWIINTGNMFITNSRDHFSKTKIKIDNILQKNIEFDDWKCKDGYNPFNIDITQINLVYCSDLNDFSNENSDVFREQIMKKEVLKNLSLKVQLMIKDFSDSNVKNDENPMVHVKISADNVRVYFNPFIYMHLLNIYDCLKIENDGEFESKEEEKIRSLQIINIFKNSTIIDNLKIKKNKETFWRESIAILSDSYIYFFKEEKAEIINMVLDFCTKLKQNEQIMKQYLSKNSENEQINVHQNLKVEERILQQAESDRKIWKMIKKQKGFLKFLSELSYEEYYFVKGCTQIQNIEEYKQQIKIRNSSFQINEVGLKENKNLDIHNEEHQIRLINSLESEIILQFGEPSTCLNWKYKIVQKAKEIDQILGKTEQNESNLGIQKQLSLEQEKQKKKISQNFEQIVTLIDIKLNKIELALEGTNQMQMNSKSVDQNTQDILILSTKQPEQFNKKNLDKPQSDFQVSWTYIATAENIRYTQKIRQFDESKQITINQLFIQDTQEDLEGKRFKYLMETIQDTEHLKQKYPLHFSEQNVLSILIKNQMIESPLYQNVMMENIVNLGKIHFNWSPVSVNRIVRFLRLYKYIKDETQTQKVNVTQSYQIQLQNIVAKKDQNQFQFYNQEDENISENEIFNYPQQNVLKLQSQVIQNNISGFNVQNDISGLYNSQVINQDNQLNDFQKVNKDQKLKFKKCTKRTSCVEDPTVFIKVILNIEKINILCIHPQNDSFPILTKQIDFLRMVYKSRFDHDVFEGHIGNFRIFDNTNYPKTLDPQINYLSNQKILSQQLLGFKLNQDVIHENQWKSLCKKSFAQNQDQEIDQLLDSNKFAMSFEIIIFHYPLDHTCPIQNENQNKLFDKIVKINFKQLQLNYMQEVIYRLNDYFFYQFLYALTDTYPYEEIYLRLKTFLDPFNSQSQTQFQQQDRFNNQSNVKQSMVSADQQKSNYLEEISQFIENLFTQKSVKDEKQNLDIYESAEENDQSSDESEESKQDGDDEANADIPDEEDYTIGQTIYQQQKLQKQQEKNQENIKLSVLRTNFKDFDLKQYPLTTGLDIQIQNPVIMIKDRPYFDSNIEIDLGRIKVTSKLENVEGKWKNHPSKKTFVNIIDIDMQQVRIDYNSKSYQITKPFDMLISFERINYSELLIDQFISKGIDFEQFNMSELISIVSSPLNFNFKQDIYTYILRILDLNINFYDNLTAGYQLFTWNSQDFMKYLDLEQKIVDKYKKSQVFKRQVILQFPSLSINLFNCNNRESDQSELLSELVLQNLQIDFKQFLDYRKILKIRSKTFYILFKDSISLNLNGDSNFNIQNMDKDSLQDEIKCLIIGPIKSKRSIHTNFQFYNSHKQENVQKDQENHKMDFIVDINMEADGAKIVDIELKSLKLFLKLDILQVVSQFFNGNYPVYQQDSVDKPSYFEADYGNYPRFEMVLNLNDCLISFEQMDDIYNTSQSKTNSQNQKQNQQLLESKNNIQSIDLSHRKKMQQQYFEKMNHQSKIEKDFNIFSKTIAFQGQLQYHFIREKYNKIKSDLLEQPSADMLNATLSSNHESVSKSKKNKKGTSDIQICSQNRLRTQQVHIIDFQPFFCDIKDLDEGGISLKHIYKRQMISPFNLYFNQNDMVEVNLKEVKQIQRYFQKMRASTNDPGTILKLKLQEKQRLNGNQNFKYFKKYELNLDLAEIQISFNDIIYLKGIIMKFQIMNQKFAEYTQILEKQKSNNIDDSRFSDFSNRQSEEKKQTSNKNILTFEFQEEKKSSRQRNQRQSLAFQSSVKKSINDIENKNKNILNNRQKDQASQYQSQRNDQNSLNQNDSVDGYFLTDITSRNITDKQLIFQNLISTERLGQNKKNKSYLQTQTIESGADKEILFTQEDKAQIQGEEELILGTDQIQIVSHGLKFILINDRDNNFIPVLSTNFSHFNINWDLNKKQQMVWTDLTLSINFFNVNVGVWEPFLEPFQVKMLANQETAHGKNQNIQLNFYSTLNINFTEKLVTNLQESSKSWQIVNKKFELFEQKYNNLKDITSNIEKQNMQADQTIIDALNNIFINEDDLIYGKKQDHKKIKNLMFDNNDSVYIQQKQLHRIENEFDDQVFNFDGLNQYLEITDQKLSDPNLNEEVITPYVIVNKTDMTIIINRFIEKQIHDRTKEKSQKIIQNQYILEQGQITEYMIDYKNHKLKQYSNQGHHLNSENEIDLISIERDPIIDSLYSSYHLNMPYPSGFLCCNQSVDSKEENIHLDSIGEYQSEFIKIQFDETSMEVQENAECFKENREIKKIDLNKIEMKSHILREGKYIESLFYGVKLIDFKKVLTIRTQFQLVNKTSSNYLIHFKINEKSIVKYMEPGDSLPLAMRLDKSKIQIKILDSNKVSNDQENKPNQSRKIYQEEMLAKTQQINDFKDLKWGVSSDWSSLIPLKILKYRLKFNEGSFLTNNVSKYTFIRKVKGDLEKKNNIIDINIMTPMIIKNCLPLDIEISFTDSSQVFQRQVWKVNEEKNLFCFSLAESISVDLQVQNFQVKHQYVLFGLENYTVLENKIDIEDFNGHKTQIYAQINRKDAGHRVVFFAKKIIIDQIQSKLQYYYLPPSYILKNKQDQNLKFNSHKIPSVQLPEHKHKLLIVPDGFLEVYVDIDESMDEKQVRKIDIETPATQAELQIQTQHQTLTYCYSTNVYLATPNEYIYNKITVVNPYYIFINQSKYTILVEQAEMNILNYGAYSGIFSDQYKNQVSREPLILQPNQRQAFFFYKINQQIPGLDEFMHFKIIDEEISIDDIKRMIKEKAEQEQAIAQDFAQLPIEGRTSSLKFQNQDSQLKQQQSAQKETLFNKDGSIDLRALYKKQKIFQKQYGWSSPFMMSEVDAFTLKISSQVQKKHINDKMVGLTNQERILLHKLLFEPKFIKVKCKANLKQAVGSQLIIIEEENEETCQYQIQNHSKILDLYYQQHIVNNPAWNKRLLVQDVSIYKCRVGQQSRFTWDSVLHLKILRVSFQLNSHFSTNSHENEKLEISQIQKDQENRVIQNHEKKYTDILIPFDKVGHTDEITLVQEIDLTKINGIKGQMPNFNYKLKIEIITNGFTKFLRMSDINDDLDIYQQNNLNRNYIQNQNRLLNENTNQNSIESSSDQGMKILDVSVSKIVLSFIHKKCELMTIFVSKLFTNITETNDYKNIKFSIGYLQIDNQAEHDPIYPILLKPRDIYYNIENDSISLKIMEEGERTNQQNTSSIFTSEDAKMFQFQMVINNRQSNVKRFDNKEVLYIENIMFLLQTLDIKIQFTHFLRIINFVQHIGKILNKSVNQVHYIFEKQSLLNERQHFNRISNKSYHLQKEKKQIFQNDFNWNQDQFSRTITDFNKEKKFLSQTPQKKWIDDINNKIFQENLIMQVNQKRNHTQNDENDSDEFSLFLMDDEFVQMQDEILAQFKKQEKLKKFAKQEILNRGFYQENIQQNHNKVKLEAIQMVKNQHNWQFAQEINQKSEWRLFIKEYQSSPTEIFVSAVNEKLNKDDSKNSKKDVQMQDQDQKNEETFTNDRQNQQDDDNLDQIIQQESAIQLLGALGEVIARKILYFSTFEDMLFRVNGININNLFGEGAEVMNMLVSFHKEQFKYNAFRVLGASNLIGNPARLINNLGTGLTDFIVKPYQGMKDGSIVKFKDGFVDGSRSLIQNSLRAPVGAMAKIAQSVSKGTLFFSFDDKFQEEKYIEERKNQSKTLGDGMKKGFASAKTSIYSGLQGVFTKPVEGLKNEGLFGFFKGGAQGAAGLVTKTISGGIDIIAKTSEGLDNQLKNKFQSDFDQRIRRPRPFYEHHNIIKPYNEFHSFWIIMLKHQNEYIDVKNLFEVFQIDEGVKVQVDFKNQRQNSFFGRSTSTTQMGSLFREEEHTSSVFILTQFKLIHIVSKIQIKKEEGSIQDRAQLESLITEGNTFQQQQEGRDQVEEIQPQQTQINMKKNNLIVQNVYDVKDIQFSETLAGQSIIYVGIKGAQSDKEPQKDQPILVIPLPQFYKHIYKNQKFYNFVNLK